MPERVVDDYGNTAIMYAGDEIDRVMIIPNKMVHVYTKKHGLIELVSDKFTYYPNVIAEINPPEEMNREDLR